MSWYNKIIGVTAPVVLSSFLAGCTAPQYRTPYGFSSERTVIEKQEYSHTLDFFVARELAIVRNDSKEFIAKNPEQEGLINLVNLKSPQKVVLSTNPIVDKISLHNSLLRELFTGKKMQRWLLDAVYKNSDPEFEAVEHVPLSDGEQKNVEETLAKLCGSLKDFQYKNMGVKPEIEAHTGIALESLSGLAYLADALTAKADIEIIEGHIIQADDAYKKVVAIKKSLSRFDEESVANEIWNRVKSTNAKALFGHNHIMQVIPTADVEIVYAGLQKEVEEILADGSYTDKHNAFQNSISFAYEIPVRLFQKGIITEDAAVMLKRRITSDFARIFSAVRKNDDTKYAPDAWQVVGSLTPALGLFSRDWLYCFCEDDFNPEGKSDKEKYVAVIREGRRLMSGDGSAEHMIGSNFSARISRGVAVVSTVAGSVLYKMLTPKEKHSSVSKSVPMPPELPPPPVGGGGTIGPGVGN